MSEADRKEQARIKQAAYNQLEHRKAERRAASSALSKANKVNTTEKRFEEHSMIELLQIARRKYAAAGIDFELCQDEIMRVLSVLHGTPFVQSTSV